MKSEKLEKSRTNRNITNIIKTRNKKHVDNGYGKLECSATISQTSTTIEWERKCIYKSCGEK